MSLTPVTTSSHVIPLTPVTTSSHMMYLTAITTSSHVMPLTPVTTSSHVMSLTPVTTSSHVMSLTPVTTSSHVMPLTPVTTSTRHVHRPARDEIEVPEEPSLPDDEDRRLWIGNLGSDVTEYSVLKLMQRFGPLGKMNFVYHKTGPDKGKPRGYCFVSFLTWEAAERARQGLDGQVVMSRRLHVKWAHKLQEEEMVLTKPRLKSAAAAASVITAPPVIAAALSASSSVAAASAETKIRAIEAKLKMMAQTQKDFSLNTTIQPPRGLQVGPHTQPAHKHEAHSTNTQPPHKYEGRSSNSQPPHKHEACSSNSQPPHKHEAHSSNSQPPHKHEARSSNSQPPHKHEARSSNSQPPHKHKTLSSNSQPSPGVHVTAHKPVRSAPYKRPSRSSRQQ